MRVSWGRDARSRKAVRYRLSFVKCWLQHSEMASHGKGDCSCVLKLGTIAVVTV